MKKFKLKTKVGQCVKKIRINIPSEGRQGSGTLYKEGVFIDDLKIVHQTENKIALSDNWITTIDRQMDEERKSEHRNYFEDISVCIKTRETYFPNGVFATIYTLGNSGEAIEKLTAAMQRKVNKDYGFMFNLNIKDKVDLYLMEK